MLADIIPELEPPHILGYTIAMGRLGDARPIAGEERFLEPIPGRINAHLAEGWTFVGINTSTTTAFMGGLGQGFASAFELRR